MSVLVHETGSSSDYGIAKAMKETTLVMLQENGMAFAAQEKENSKVPYRPFACVAVGSGTTVGSIELAPSVSM